jgi:hypothetical protein
VSGVGNEVAGYRRTGGPAHRGELRSSSWRSTTTTMQTGGSDSFIYPFANDFVVHDTDYAVEARKILQAGNPPWAAMAVSSAVSWPLR